MRAALRGKYTVTATGLTDEAKQILLIQKEECYWQIALSQPMQQDGVYFSWLVAPIKFTTKLKGEQTGAGVLCQTESEAKETFDNLIARNKKHLVSFHSGRLGGIGWATNLRRYSNERKVVFRNLPDGKTLWLAIEREIDLDTLEVNVIRRKETETEGEANYWFGQWTAEYENKRKSYFDSISQIVTPPPPHCTAITPLEIEDLGNAKMIAVQRQWPRCFKIFERQKLNPNLKIPDQEVEDAYLLDLVANGGDPFLKNVNDGKIRADMELISALHNAAQNYARRGKSKIIDAAIYMIAFNWEFGWCYFSDQQLAETLEQFLETSFTAEQVKKYRLNILGLVAKHKPGLPPKSSSVK